MPTALRGHAGHDPRASYMPTQSRGHGTRAPVVQASEIGGCTGGSGADLSHNARTTRNPIIPKQTKSPIHPDESITFPKTPFTNAAANAAPTNANPAMMRLTTVDALMDRFVD